MCDICESAREDAHFQNIHWEGWEQPGQKGANRETVITTIYQEIDMFIHTYSHTLTHRHTHTHTHSQTHRNKHIHTLTDIHTQTHTHKHNHTQQTADNKQPHKTPNTAL